MDGFAPVAKNPENGYDDNRMGNTWRGLVPLNTGSTEAVIDGWYENYGQFNNQ